MIQNAGFRPVLLAGTTPEEVVDVDIQRTLEALVARDCDLLVGSHDRDFALQIEQLIDSDHGVALIGSREAGRGVYAELGVHIYDPEYDLKALNQRLARIRVVPLAAFDPEEFLRPRALQLSPCAL